MVFRILNKDPLGDIREAAFLTLGIENVPEFTGDAYEYYLNRFIEKHSIIRSVRFRIKNKTKKTIIAQLIRATKGAPQPYVQSSRPDWNGGKPRDTGPEAESLYGHDHTPESFMFEMSQRLCTRTEKPTREEALLMVLKMKSGKDLFFRALAHCCVPNCFLQGGCPEGKRNCHFFEASTSKASKWDLMDIKTRYAIYHRMLPERLL